jgi:hypothetical protein
MRLWRSLAEPSGLPIRPSPAPPSRRARQMAPLHENVATELYREPRQTAGDGRFISGRRFRWRQSPLPRAAIRTPQQRRPVPDRHKPRCAINEAVLLGRGSVSRRLQVAITSASIPTRHLARRDFSSNELSFNSTVTRARDRSPKRSRTGMSARVTAKTALAGILHSPPAIG